MVILKPFDFTLYMSSTANMIKCFDDSCGKCFQHITKSTLVLVVSSLLSCQEKAHLKIFSQILTCDIRRPVMSDEQLQLTDIISILKKQKQPSFSYFSAVLLSF